MFSGISKTARGVIDGFYDKSISHRSVILSSLAKGQSTIKNLLESEDVLRTLAVFSSMGVKIDKKDDLYLIDSKGILNFDSSEQSFFMGNSGTSCRLISGVLASIPNMKSIIIGDKVFIKKNYGENH